MLDETKVTIIWQKITFKIRWMTLDILTLNIVLITVGKTVTLLLGYFQEKFYAKRQLCPKTVEELKKYRDSE